MRRLVLFGVLTALTNFPAVAVELEDAERALMSGDYAVAETIYRTLAEQGDVQGMIRLAGLYQKGEGVERDVRQAAQLYRRAAQTGNAEAQFSLGNLYLMGEGVPQDDEWALSFYRLAAKQGHALAYKNMRELYRAGGMEAPAFDGPHVPDPKSPDIDAGPVSMTGVGGVEKRAPGVVGDRDVNLPPAGGSVQATANAVHDAEPPPAQAVSEDAAAQESLSDEDVVEISVDEAEAIQLARDNGIDVSLDGPVVMARQRTTDPTATGEAHQSGGAMIAAARQALEQERFTDAFTRFDELARTGNAEAQYVLSRLLTSGNGVTKNEPLALKWLRRAAEGGYAEAQFQLAERYVSGGLGIAPDDAMAITLYREAARAGHQPAKERLSSIYAGAGLPAPAFSNSQQPAALYMAPEPGSVPELQRERSRYGSE